MFNVITLVDTIRKIGEAIPNINTVILSDIYQLNSLPDVEYSCFCITQGRHRADDEYFYFNFVLFYVDRLLNDKSNQLEIQSHGIQLLKTVTDKLDELGLIINGETDKIYQVFTQRFSDETAGAYVELEIQVPFDCQIPYPILVDPLLADLAVYLPGEYYPQDFGADAFRVVTVSGQSYHYYTENGTTASINNGEHSLSVEQSGVYIDGNEVTTNDVLSGYTYDKQTTNNLIQAALEGFDNVIAQVSANTTNIAANSVSISTLSAMTSDNTEGIATLSAMTGDFVRKDPTNVEGSSGSPIDFNTLTAETGYYYLTINNEYAVNGPQAGGWQSDGMLEVIRDPESTRVVQVFTANYGPHRWYRTYTWFVSGFEWTDWQQVPLKDDYVEKQPTLHTYSPGYVFDFDEYTTTGYYVLENMNSGNTHNCPVEGGNAILHVIALRKDGVLDDCIQLYYTADNGTGNTDIYLRRYYWLNGVYYWGEWTKISGSGSGGGQVDTQMADNSTNPVENRVVTSAITHLQDEIDNINIGQSWDGDDIQTLLRQINSLTERVAALEACSPCSGDTSGSTSGDTSGSTSGDTSGSTSGGTLEIPSGLTGNTIVYRATYPQQKYLFNEYEDRFGGAKIIDNYYLAPDGTRVGNIFYSNVDYNKGYGVIEFDRPLTAITNNVGFNSVSPDNLRTGVYFNEIHLPASLTSLGNYVFDFGANGDRKNIYSLATTAPTTTEDSIHRPLDAANHDEGSKLYIPSGATGYDVWLDELGDHWSIENI